MSAFDDHVHDALNRTLEAMRARLESDIASCRDDLVRAAAEASSLIETQAKDTATANAQRDLERQLTEWRDAAAREAEERERDIEARLRQAEAREHDAEARERDADSRREEAEAKLEMVERTLEELGRSAAAREHDAEARERDADFRREEAEAKLEMIERTLEELGRSAEAREHDAEARERDADSRREEAEAKLEMVERTLEELRRSSEDARLQGERDVEAVRRELGIAAEETTTSRQQFEAAREEAELAKSQLEQRFDEIHRLGEEIHRLEEATRGAQDALTQAARLPQALQQLDRAASLGEALDGLVQCAATEAERAVIFLVKGGRLHDWRSVGFDRFSERLEISADAPGPFADAVRGERGRCRDAELPAFAAHPDPRYAVMLPVSVGGAVVAVLYADRFDADKESEPIWPSRLDVLARYAGRMLESITIRQAAGLSAATSRTASAVIGHPPAGSVQ